MTQPQLQFIVTCEHGGNDVPQAYAAIFESSQAVLESHRGWDAGTLELATNLAQALTAPLFSSTTTRLLIDLNRSLNHPDLFSEWSRKLSPGERSKIIDNYYTPHRSSIASAIRTATRLGPVVHIGVHSFTPIWDGQKRETDIGLLFDPSRNLERRICSHWKEHLGQAFSRFRIHLNKPYLGIDDGLTTELRTRFTDEFYAGIEIEVNQKLLEPNTALIELVDTFVDATKGFVCRFNMQFHES